MKWWSVPAAILLAMASAPAWAQWQYYEDLDLAEARVEADGARLAVACEYDDWDDEVYEEVRLAPSARGAEKDVEALKARSPRLTVRIDGWEWARDAYAFHDSGEKRIYFWAGVNEEVYKRLAAASAPIRATVTLSSPAEVLADHSFSPKGSKAAMRKYQKECDDLW